MNFNLTEDQQLLRDTAQSFVNDQLPVARLRKLREEGANKGDPETQSKLAELGFFGTLTPEEFGGSDFGMVGLGQILEAQGRTIALTPLVQTALIGATALTLGGSADQKSEWLPKIAAGQITTALALDEGTHHAPTRIAAAAAKDGDGYTLNGVKRFVPDGHIANLLIVAARTSGAENDANGISLFLVPSDATGITVQNLATVDSHGAAHITFDGVNVGASNVLGTVDRGSDILDPVLDRARIGLAAEMLGASAAAFEITLEYLQTRKQFGQLIGSFQALQHRAAQMFTEIELTRSAVAAALSAVDESANDVPELASLAKARAAETLHLVSNETVQMHGGIGMTDEHDAGLYMKRARVLEALYGGEGFHRDRYARLMGF